MSLVGSLEDLGLGDILQIVSLSRKSGLLMIRNQPLYDYFRSIEKRADQGYAAEDLEQLLTKAHLMWEETLDVLKDEKAKLSAES